MIVDAHLHCSGKEDSKRTLVALDEAGIDYAVLLAPFLTPPYSLSDRDSLRQANQHLSNLVSGRADRLNGFAVVNPSHAESVDDLTWAVQDLGLRGLKLVPHGWYPYDDCAHAVYQRAEELRIPVLFHSGIFIDGRSSRFCRPVFYEAVRDHPNLRVTLAHLGWPWCDEAIAVGLMDLINGRSPGDCQIHFDISFGPPPIYRHEVLRRALDVLGPGLLQFGSDRFLPCSGADIRSAIEEVNRLLEDLAVSPEARESVMSETAGKWLGLKRGSKVNDGS